jgi:nucleotide-binding universal stress UspA family protein
MALAVLPTEGDSGRMILPLRPPRPVEDGARCIVAGVADSASAHAAVRWAVDRARVTGAGITLLHVEESGEAGRAVLPRLGLVSGRDLLTRELRFARSAAPAVRATTERLQGDVMWALGAASAKAEMVVVGTHKSGFIHGTVYGSTTLQLAATARCPVVVVPAPSLGASAGVVLGADDSPAGRAALHFAAAEADGSGTDLLIVRVLALGVDGDDASRRADAAALLDDFQETALAAHPGLDVDARVVHGQVAHTLVTMSTGARLLVLGDARSDTGQDPLALGAVCHDALLNIQTPTVIVHVGDLDLSTDRAAIGTARVPRA